MKKIIISSLCIVLTLTIVTCSAFAILGTKSEKLVNSFKLNLAVAEDSANCQIIETTETKDDINYKRSITVKNIGDVDGYVKLTMNFVYEDSTGKKYPSFSLNPLYMVSNPSTSKVYRNTYDETGYMEFGTGSNLSSLITAQTFTTYPYFGSKMLSQYSKNGAVVILNSSNYYAYLDLPTALNDTTVNLCNGAIKGESGTVQTYSENCDGWKSVNGDTNSFYYTTKLAPDESTSNLIEALGFFNRSISVDTNGDGTTETLFPVCEIYAEIAEDPAYFTTSVCTFGTTASGLMYAF